jgi:S1-C subfamily serine protease
MITAFVSGLFLLVSIAGARADDTTANVFLKLKPSLAIIANSQGVGTGFCISSTDTSSYYLTNAHVVGNDDTVTVYRQYPTAQKMTGTVVARGIDEDPDLAVVKVPIPHIAAVTLITGPLHEGDPIADAGYPVAQYDLSTITGTIAPSIHTGTISALENRGGVVEYDAQTLPGNSGGPLFDPRTGAVGAIVRAKLVGTTEANLGIGIARVVLPFLHEHAIAYHEYTGSASGSTIASAPQPANDNEAILKAPPGAETVAIIYDTTLSKNTLSADGLTNSVSDFSNKFRTQFHVNTVLVDQHLSSNDDFAKTVAANNALIGVYYGAYFRQTSFYQNAYGTYTKWEFSLTGNMVDSYGIAWGGPPKIAKNVSSSRGDMQNVIESSLADLNDKLIAAYTTAPNYFSDPDIAINFFKYGFPMKTGVRRGFFNLVPDPSGARAKVFGDFSPAAQAGLQNDDIVLQINGTPLAGFTQDQLIDRLKTINDADGAFDLTIRAADGKETHIKFQSQTLRWYVDHRTEAAGSG